MLVIDTSALISLAVGDALEPALDAFDIVTTESVTQELEATADYDDRHGKAAHATLEMADALTIVDVQSREFETSRIDAGEASCVAATREHNADFLVTDDFRALPELQELLAVEVVLSPIVLRALVQRGRLSADQAETSFEEISDGRDWLGASIYRYARELFEE